MRLRRVGFTVRLKRFCNFLLACRKKKQCNTTESDRKSVRVFTKNITTYYIKVKRIVWKNLEFISLRADNILIVNNVDYVNNRLTSLSVRDVTSKVFVLL